LALVSISRRGSRPSSMTPSTPIVSVIRSVHRA
jgi:hypothetical protein